MNVKHTGVFASDEETAECLRLFKVAQQTPVMAIDTAHALNHGGFAGQAWDRVNKTVHGYALAHGLPEFAGYYGMALENGEFLIVGEDTGEQ
jgi:hypothetical protein